MSHQQATTLERLVADVEHTTDVIKRLAKSALGKFISGKATAARAHIEKVASYVATQQKFAMGMTDAIFRKENSTRLHGPVLEPAKKIAGGNS